MKIGINGNIECKTNQKTKDNVHVTNKYSIKFNSNKYTHSYKTQNKISHCTGEMRGMEKLKK